MRRKRGNLLAHLRNVASAWEEVSLGDDSLKHEWLRARFGMVGLLV